MSGMLATTTRFALDLLFPPQCALCRHAGTLLCDVCAATLPVADGLRCEVCWMPVRSPQLCRHCVEAPPAFTSLRSAYVLEGGARRLVHELKYDGMTSFAEPMARLMAHSVDSGGVDLLVAVPLHVSRERSRGYNQATALAKHLSAITEVPLARRAARRTRATAPLVKTMRREERRAIVRGAFAGKRDVVEGRRILLMDDVVTTGATLDECSRALLEAGAASVRCATWARAD